VVICAYTEARWNDLVAAVVSCQVQRLPAHEVIVVIDHNPALMERVAREVPGIVVTENVEQRGLSGARNSGLRVATGEVVAFIDDDAFSDPGWLEALAGSYADPAVMASGGTIEPLWERGRPGWFPREFDWVIGCTYLGMPTQRAAVRNLIGCNMSFRAEVFDEIGGFVHGVGRIGSRPLGCEETEICIRARQRWPERTIVFEPSAVVHHRVPAARGTVGYFRSRCYAEGLSKAMVARLVGGGDALSTERGYALRVLGGGVLRELRSVVRHPHAAAVERALAIVFGLAVTTAGFVMGSASIRRGQVAFASDR
jgi:glycosyltransferase involved in cell wall biosynthesis